VNGFLARVKKGLFYLNLALPLLVPAFPTISDANVISPISGLRHPFVENRGQVRPDIAFHTRLFNGSFQVTKQGEMLLQLPPPKGQSSGGISICERLIGGSGLEVRKGRKAQTKVSYFIGNDPEKWWKNLPTFHSLVLEGCQSKIGLELHIQDSNVEKRFLVQPGGDPESIQIKVSGVKRLSALTDGRLALDTNKQTIHFSQPFAYQQINNAVRQVDVAYRVEGDGYGFRVGPYDKTRELVIDPLYQATYLGGGNNDYINAMEADPATNEVYVAGSTNSIIPGGPLSVRQGLDAFVARFNPGLTELLSLSYLGGAGTDQAIAITFLVMPCGSDVYVAGNTDSDDFAGVTASSAQSNYLGSQDAFIAYFNADLSSLQAASYFGGYTLCDGAYFATTDVSDVAYGSIDGTHIIYMAGKTSSSNLYGRRRYPTAQYTCGGGGADGYVTAFNLDLDDFINTTYLGGSGYDSVQALTPAIGRVFVAGNTTSDDLPGVDAGSSQAVRGGGVGSSEEDAFITRLESDLTTFERSTYFGGSGSDTVSQLVYTGTLFIGGSTTSTDLPGISGALQETPNDIYLARIFSTLDTDALTQSTYLGGSGDENLQDIAYEESNGYLYLVGSTSSTDLPGVSGGVQETLEGSQDAFVIRMTDQLTPPSLSGGTFQSTYLGGPSSPEEIATAVALSNHMPGAAVYVAGITTSDSFPEISGGAQPYRSGGLSDYMEGFVSFFDETLLYDPGSEPTPPDIRVELRRLYFDDVPINGTRTVFVHIHNDGGLPLIVTDISFTDSLGVYNLDTWSCGSTSFSLMSGEWCSIEVSFTPLEAISYLTELTITSNDPDEGLIHIDVSGSGISGPEIEVHWLEMDMGSIRRRSEFINDIAIYNMGTEDLVIDSIRLEPDPSDHFAISESGSSSSCDLSNMPFTVIPPIPRPGYFSNCYFQVAFHPQELGEHTARVIISSNDLDEPEVTVTLTGRGRGPSLDDCFIATAAYGTQMHEDVQLLRDFRDDYLLSNPPGRAFVAFYYEHSPPIAAYISEREWLRTLTRWVLAPIVYSIKCPGAVSSITLAFALGLIALRRRHKQISLASPLPAPPH
jgi:hypothetical protein